jgi:hypothetical protein
MRQARLNRTNNTPAAVESQPKSVRMKKMKNSLSPLNSKRVRGFSKSVTGNVSHTVKQKLQVSALPTYGMPRTRFSNAGWSSSRFLQMNEVVAVVVATMK